MSVDPVAALEVSFALALRGERVRTFQDFESAASADAVCPTRARDGKFRLPRGFEQAGAGWH